MVNTELRHQAWRLICEYFPGRSNRALRNEIFNYEFDPNRVVNDSRRLLDTIAFNCPQLVSEQLTEIHDLAVEARGGEAHV